MSANQGITGTGRCYRLMDNQDIATVLVREYGEAVAPRAYRTKMLARLVFLDTQAGKNMVHAA